MRARVEFGLALLLLLIGAGGVLLLAGRHWQTIATSGSFGDESAQVSGRTLDAAPTAFALVALAGIVAVLATRGWVRRGVGLIVALAGAAVIWRAALDGSAVGAARARDLLRSGNPHATFSSTAIPTVMTHEGWAGLSIVGGGLVLLAGAMIAALGARWSAMSAKYEAPSARSVPDAEQERARADARLWTALDRGEDPTDG